MEPVCGAEKQGVAKEGGRGREKERMRECDKERERGRKRGSKLSPLCVKLSTKPRSIHVDLKLFASILVIFKEPDALRRLSVVTGFSLL